MVYHILYDIFDDTFLHCRSVSHFGDQANSAHGLVSIGVLLAFPRNAHLPRPLFEHEKIFTSTHQDPQIYGSDYMANFSPG